MQQHMAPADYLLNLAEQYELAEKLAAGEITMSLMGKQEAEGCKRALTAEMQRELAMRTILMKQSHVAWQDPPREDAA